jgi:hypothetical protein
MAQFIVELVGPRPTPGVLAKEALQHPWYEALGKPEVYCMAAEDRCWRPMTIDDPAPSYDSVALAWRYLDPRGRLTGRAAERLYQGAERLAVRFERVAMPLLPPDQVDSHVRSLEELRNRFDVMVAVTVRPTTGWIDPDHATDLMDRSGFLRTSSGWGLYVPDWPEPLVEAVGVDDPTMDPSRILGIDFGLRVARNPAPSWSLERLFDAIQVLSSGYRCLTVDDEGQLVDHARMTWIRAQVTALTKQLQQHGLPAGSPEARMVFFD